MFLAKISENKRDTMWLISVGRLAVRAVIKWCCYVKTEICPIENCTENETIEHLLLNCQRSKDVWRKMASIGFNINVNFNSVMYGVFSEQMPRSHQEFFWIIICTVVTKIWKTRCAVVLHKTNITSNVVFKQILTELKKQRTIDTKQKRLRLWHLLTL